ncbi:hypothetical protein [Xanthomonas phage NEB7]|nr:hypothetical protein [Xanthomonas phage NEB7]
MDEQHQNEQREQLITRVDDLLTRQFGSQNGGHATINGQGPSTAMWVVVVIAALFFGWNIANGGRQTEAAVRQAALERKVDRLQDHLTAIYALAPALKPEQLNEKKP